MATNVRCIQDTLSSRAALGLPASAFRPSASREQRYLAYNLVRGPGFPAFRPSVRTRKDISCARLDSVYRASLFTCKITLLERALGLKAEQTLGQARLRR